MAQLGSSELKIHLPCSPSVLKINMLTQYYPLHFLKGIFNNTQLQLQETSKAGVMFRVHAEISKYIKITCSQLWDRKRSSLKTKVLH